MVYISISTISYLILCSYCTLDNNNAENKIASDTNDILNIFDDRYMYILLCKNIDKDFENEKQLANDYRKLNKVYHKILNRFYEINEMHINFIIQCFGVYEARYKYTKKYCHSTIKKIFQFSIKFGFPQNIDFKDLVYIQSVYDIACTILNNKIELKLWVETLINDSFYSKIDWENDTLLINIKGLYEKMNDLIAKISKNNTMRIKYDKSYSQWPQIVEKYCILLRSIIQMREKIGHKIMKYKQYSTI